MDDFELLQSYASERSEEAFSTLTKRYIDLVYSAALRQTGQCQVAEDLTQAVFLILARKAGSIRRETVLAGWLLRATRFAAANARRLEQRRQHYETQAMQANIYPTETEAVWPQVAPLLDEALERLGEKDRNAIVLRFFEKKSLKQVGVAMGVSEDGAQKRITRAIEKLRVMLARRSKAVSIGALSGALAAYSAQAAPADLSVSVSRAFGPGAAVRGAGITALVNATLQTLVRERFKIMAVRAVSVVLLLVVGVVILSRSQGPGAASRPSPTLTLLPAPASNPPNASQAGPAPSTEVAAVTAPPELAQIQMRVLDAQSAAAVKNARLTLVSVAGGAGRTTNILLSDEQGLGVISYTPVAVKSWQHQIEVFRDGYAPKYVSWSEAQQDHVGEIPAEYTVKLEPAVTIGGVVINEQDGPVSGVRVVFSVSGPISSQARERLTMMGDYHTELAGENGRWSCNHVPRRFGMIDYRIVHPDYQEKLYACDSPDSPASFGVDHVAEADLLAGKAVMRIKAGLIISGLVLDETGQPVAGAKVTQDFAFRDPERTRQTAADGAFQFHNGVGHDLSLTVQAANLAPIVTSIVLYAQSGQLRLVLPQGRLLSGRVVDAAEQPIAGAWIKPRSPTADSRTLFEWRARSDTEGGFSWENAPATQEYAVGASGYETEDRVPLTADGTEQVIKLKKQATASMRIFGQIVDAETKSPAAGARVQIWETIREKNGSFSTFTGRAEDVAADGSFRLKTSPGTIRYALEAQADDYSPARLTNDVTAITEVRLKMELTKAPLCAGVVLTPANEPAAGATLVVCSHDGWAQMSKPGKLQLGTSYVGTMADAEGRFRLPPKHAPESVVIAHEQGFEAVPFGQMSSNTVITLQPWGRIEGTLRLAGKPLAREHVRLNRLVGSEGLPRVSVVFDAQTDEEGRFTFETVPPREWMVEHAINVRPLGKLRMDFPLGSHGVPVRVQLGETAHVSLGGTGRPVVGKAVAPGNTKPPLWTENSASLTLKIPAGMPQLRRDYGAVFAADGSFRIDDVPAGDYTLKISLLDLPTGNFDNLRENPKIVGSIEMDVTVPASIGDAGEPPVDLGILQLGTSRL